jgi:DNA-nicking Smr family endonuclease
MGGDTADDEPIRIPIEDSLDLHAFAPADVRSVVDDYLHEAHARGFREVRLIHGRGIGAQRASVQSFLARHPLVERYADAPPQRGGWGATIAYLS